MSDLACAFVDALSSAAIRGLTDGLTTALRAISTNDAVAGTSATRQQNVDRARAKGVVPQCGDPVVDAPLAKVLRILGGTVSGRYH